MTNKTLLPILTSLFFVGGTGVSLADQTFRGDVQDPRVVSCGISLTGENMYTIRPFIEASEEISGTLDLVVESISGSNRNATMQKTSLKNMPVVTVSGDALNIVLIIESEGHVLCEINQKVDFGRKDI